MEQSVSGEDATNAPASFTLDIMPSRSVVRIVEPGPINKPLLFSSSS